MASRGNRLRLTPATGQPGTLVIELALTEITFGRPETYVASMAVTGGGIAESAMMAPTVAFEAKVTDAATGKVVATAADRRSTRIKVVDFNRLSVTKANEEICDEWAQQLMQAFNKDLFPTVKRKMFPVY